MINDIKALNRKMGVKKKIAKEFDNYQKLAYLEFRAKFIQEELNELLDAVIQKDSDDIVDALIDIIVVALGTLDAYNINIKKAWNRVHDANMKKMVGHNSTRKNIYNLPDLVKPYDWQSPQHFDNVGELSFLQEEDDAT